MEVSSEWRLRNFDFFWRGSVLLLSINDNLSRDPQRLFGKISKNFFDQVIFANLGAKRKEVVAGPTIGVDNCVIKVGSGEVIVATTDPLSYIPELGPEDSAWLSVNLIASDLTTSGFQPQYLVLDFNLPPTMPDSLFEEYWKALSKECNLQGIAIVGGHTGRFEGIDSTVIGGGVMFSIGSSRTYLTSAMGKVGDKIIITKGAGIAATGILARVFRNLVETEIGEEGLEEAQAYFRKITTVKDALTAAAVGVRSLGVNAMHDCTEGGVLSGIHELALASSLGVHVYKSEIPVSQETRKICEKFRIDPLVSLGEGALVISCNPQKTEAIVNTLANKGIPASIVGELKESSYGMRISDADGESELTRPETDLYWKAYYDAKERGWN